MFLSVVATMYKSEAYVEDFYSRIIAEAEKITDDFEIILVNDGCPRNSLDAAINIHKRDSRVKVINLSRNFGHHKAMMAGLRYSSGDYVFLIDIDLEEEPELLGLFYGEITNNADIDVAFGVQDSRKGGYFEKISGTLFYKVINLFSGINIPENLTTARLMKRKYVDALLLFKEKEFVIAGLWALAGFNQRSVKVTKTSTSKTTYSIFKKIDIATRFITSLSSKPMTGIFYLGLSVTVLSFLFVLKIIIGKLLNNHVVSGYSSTIASIWLLGGLIIFCIGIIGVYVATIFNEVKQRPVYIVKEVYEKEYETNTE